MSILPYDYGSSDQEAASPLQKNSNTSSPKIISSSDEMRQPGEPTDSSLRGIAVNDRPHFSAATKRKLVQSFTLPPLPNTLIPTSPPDSPQTSVSMKIGHFLELKSQDIHLNAKLGSSSALQNPSLLSNLMGFAGIDTELGQYKSTMSNDSAPVPENGFPGEVYDEELSQSQQRILKKIKTGKRGNLEFASSGSHT